MANEKAKYSAGKEFATAEEAQTAYDAKVVVVNANHIIDDLNKAFKSIQIAKNDQVAKDHAVLIVQTYFRQLSKLLLYLEGRIKDWPDSISLSLIAVYQKYRQLLEMVNVNDINIDDSVGIKLLSNSPKTSVVADSKIEQTIVPDKFNQVAKNILENFSKFLIVKLNAGQAPLIPALAFLKTPTPEIIYRALDNPSHAKQLAILDAVVADASKLTDNERQAREAFHYALDHDEKRQLMNQTAQKSFELLASKNGADLLETFNEQRKFPIIPTAQQALNIFAPGFWVSLGRRLNGSNLLAGLKTAEQLVNSLTLAMQNQETETETPISELLKTLTQKQGVISRILGRISGRPNYREILLANPEELTRLLAETHTLHEKAVKDLLVVDANILATVKHSNMFQTPDIKNLSLQSFIDTVNNIDIGNKNLEANVENDTGNKPSNIIPMPHEVSRNAKTGEFTFSNFATSKSETVTTPIACSSMEFSSRELTAMELEKETKRLLELGYTLSELKFSVDGYDKDSYSIYHYSLEDIAFAKKWGLKECEDTFTYARWKAFKMANLPNDEYFDKETWKNFKEAETKNNEPVSNEIAAYVKWRYFVDLTERAVKNENFNIIPQQVSYLLEDEQTIKDPWNESNLLKLFVSVATKYPTQFFAHANKYAQMFTDAQNHLLDRSNSSKTVFSRDYIHEIAAASAKVQNSQLIDDVNVRPAGEAQASYMP